MKLGGILKKAEFSWATSVMPVPERWFLQDMWIFHGYLESCTRDWPVCHCQGRGHFCKSGKGELFTTLNFPKHTNNCCWIRSQRSWSWTRILDCTTTTIYHFQRMIVQPQNGLIRMRCYLNDIIFAGKSTEEHLNNLSRVLQRLQGKGYHLKNDNCHFLQSTVEY